ncbi:hypothetical protein [Acinetobacter sp. Ac_5812]|uniref:hypothetical protein n=1 Tax=Acinetobacter sp. Ac_5812 TaxID=1848937 RepID=UPI0014900FAB|nr:hypothetical protein [Acinetobacter sp. Ac_5812]NNP70950.1 hypothetical protein [Acinetobacter sp. Ac_5812]
MNAITFIKQHGVEKAREVVAKDKFVADLCLITPSGNLIYYKEVKGSFPEVTDFGRVELTADDYLMFDLSDLKSIVESVDLVESLGGVKGAETEAHNCRYYEYADMTHRAKMIYEAVADYELIYGGEHV